MQLEKINLDDIKVGEIAPTKFGLDLMAEAIAEQVKDGYINPLDAVIRLNAMGDIDKDGQRENQH
jgi:hypothetical protein